MEAHQVMSLIVTLRIILMYGTQKDWTVQIATDLEDTTLCAFMAIPHLYRVKF
jgi:hypothetical protein